MQFGKDGFGRHEHQRQVLRLARNEVFVRNVADVPCKILAQPRGGLLALVLALGFAQGGNGLERELGVDRQRAPVGQEYRAIRPAFVRERELEFVAVLRQPILHDEPNAPLAEGAALLLVASTLCSEVTCDAKSVMFRCALSMTASRSLSLCRLSTVCWRVVVIDWLRLCVTESSRSLTAR